MKLLYLLVLCLLPVLTNGLEMIVGTAKGLMALQNNGKNYTGHKMGGYTMYDVSIPTLAVDVAHNRIFFARSLPLEGVLVQVMPLHSDEESPTIETVIQKAQGPESVRTLVYDEIRETLYWTDPKKGEISMISVKGALDGQNATLIHSSKAHPTGIAIDVCRGLLFWTNGYHLNPSVQRSNADGSDVAVIASTQLFMPVAVTVDPAGEGHLFWADEMEGSEHKIEMSKLDGSQRVTLVKETYQTPFSVSYVPFDGRSGLLLWTDVDNDIIWEMEIINGRKASGKGPKEIYNFQGTTTMGLIASASFNATHHRTTCRGMETVAVVAEEANKTAIEEQNVPTLASEERTWPPLEEPVTQMETQSVTSEVVRGTEPTSTNPQNQVAMPASQRNDSREASDSPLPLPCNNYCINGEPVEDNIGKGGSVAVRCRCSPGYSGSRCEKSMCDNYCVHGSCRMEMGSEGLWEAKCDCRMGFVGKRCERDLCWRYCLNGGRCRVESGQQPKCSCLGNGKLAKGERCERFPNPLEKVCSLLCAQDSSKASISFVPLEAKEAEVVDGGGPHCVCPSGSTKYMYPLSKGGLNSTDEWGGAPPGAGSDAAAIASPLVLALSGLCLVLLVIALYLTFKVMKLRRLPRIKKRIIVSKGSVPLAAGAGGGGGACGGGRGRSGGAGSPVVEEQQQCEITIENCCNMNVCETPCFEPQLRSPGKSSNSRRKMSTKEEKKELLVNMESGTKASCGPCPGVEELY
ncbi:protein cueball-like [Hetaerina americana]|uniref:protein cueball-like n=1 Tax=Hetaerina americana TaxID=62018 RepID=UPI003A7F2C71